MNKRREEEERRREGEKRRETTHEHIRSIALLSMFVGCDFCSEEGRRKMNRIEEGKRTKRGEKGTRSG